MVHVREGLFKNGFDFNIYAILEMFQSYWTKILNSKHNAHYKYYCWKVEFKNELLKALKRVWTKDLPDFELFIINMNNLKVNFDPTIYTNFELNMQKSIMVKDKLKKDSVTKKNYCKTFTFLILVLVLFSFYYLVLK